MPQPPAHFVPHYRVADRPRYHKTHPRHLVAGGCGIVRYRVVRQHVHDETSPASSAASLHGRGELVPAPQTMFDREHVLVLKPYADRRARPLDRREERTARPARVRIRSRKPWVLARRRLFGWYVRLLTVDAFHAVTCSGST